MNRDAVLATIIGFILGLTITTLIIIWPKAVSMFQTGNTLRSKTVKTQPTTQVSPAVTGKNTTKPRAEFTVDAPVTDTITTESDLLVSGKAPAGSYVIIGGLSDEIAMLVPREGTYAGKVTLLDGQNTVHISNIENGTVKNTMITVYYNPGQSL